MSKKTEERVLSAKIFHEKGYNCAQAVACAFQDQVDLPMESLFKVSEGLGLGGGDMQGTCGAVAAISLVMGLRESSGNLEHPDSKAATYKCVRELAKIFRDQNGSTICKELKGVETGKVLRTCPDCISDAVKILSDVLDQE